MQKEQKTKQNENEQKNSRRRHQQQTLISFDSKKWCEIQVETTNIAKNELRRNWRYSFRQQNESFLFLRCVPSANRTSFFVFHFFFFLSRRLILCFTGVCFFFLSTHRYFGKQNKPMQNLILFCSVDGLRELLIFVIRFGFRSATAFRQQDAWMSISHE